MIRTPIVNPVRAPIKANEKRPIFSLAVCGNTLVDEISGQQIQCSIAGSRYGIRNGVLTTFAANKPAIEDLGFRAFPAYTQLAPKTETLTDAAWTKTNVTLAATTSFQGCAMWDMRETATNGPHSITASNAFAGAVDASYLVATWIVKANARKACIRFVNKAGTTTEATYNLTTYYVETSTLTAAKVVHLGNGYCRLIAIQLAGTGATTPSATLLINSSGSTSYTGNTGMGLIVGQPTFVSCGTNGAFMAPYTPNTGTSGVAIVSETSSGANGMFFDLDSFAMETMRKHTRGVVCEGSYEFDFISGFQTDWLKNQSLDMNLMASGNTSFNMCGIRKYADGTTRAFSIDSSLTGFTSNITTIMFGNTYKIRGSWGLVGTTKKHQLMIGNVKSVPVNGSGNFGSGDLKFFPSNYLFPGWIIPNTLKFYATPSWVI